MAVRRGPRPRSSPPHTGRPLEEPCSRPHTYSLVNELELEVALTAVWVGLGAGLQPVPLILPAAQVLVGQVGRRAHAHGQHKPHTVGGRGATGGWPQAPLGVDPEPLPRTPPEPLFPDPTHL